MCVDQLNTNTVSQFSHLKSFRESIGKKKVQDRFYKGEEGLNLRGSFNHRTSFEGSSVSKQKSVRHASSVVRERQSRGHNLNGALNASFSSKMGNNTINLTHVSDTDRIKIMNNSDRLASYNFIR